ncbi:hypothetical protein GQ607_010292, partial [Colletotrichum asianum]
AGPERNKKTNPNNPVKRILPATVLQQTAASYTYHHTYHTPLFSLRSRKTTKRAKATRKKKKRLAICMCCLPPSLHLTPPAPSQSSVPKLAISFSEKGAANSGVSPSSGVQCFFRPGSNDDVASSQEETPTSGTPQKKHPRPLTFLRLLSGSVCCKP